VPRLGGRNYYECMHPHPQDARRTPDAVRQRCAAAAERLEKLKPTGAYDTPAQTEDRKLALACWALEPGADGQPKNTSAERPAAGRKEYGLKVLEILKRQRPHPITYAAYETLDTDAYLDGRGDFLYDAWLTLGALPKEISRTLIGDDEIVAYQWKNPDGSHVIATFRNARPPQIGSAGRVARLLGCALGRGCYT
jgi:hypothetical protein